jgi:hypothetical protein
MELKSFSPGQLLFWTILLTIAFEAITLLFRFGLQMESTRDTASTVGMLTAGIRVHHGYIGLFIACLAFTPVEQVSRFTGLALIVGLALFLSDLIHHFLVLWPITGSPEFDLIYPAALDAVD